MLIIFTGSFVFGKNITVTKLENTTGFFQVNVTSEEDDKNLLYTWTRNGVLLTSSL